MKSLILLVGPPGAGKTTHCSNYPQHIRISQDDQGKEHWNVFQEALLMGQDIIIDRMNFSKKQRDVYLLPAKAAGYRTEIVVLHTPKDVCYTRCVARCNNSGHPTMATPQDASNALNAYFKQYERVLDNEADTIIRLGWNGPKDRAIIVDLDGTLANVKHRLHLIEGSEDITERKKDWKSFFEAGKDDVINEWCAELIWGLQDKYKIIIVTARPDVYRQQTIDWLQKHDVIYDAIYMREKDDYRHDSIVKENILDYELFSRYDILMCVDDRSSVIDLWRRRGLVALQCDSS